jgi:periplasmic divalent cation tolerance protein
MKIRMAWTSIDSEESAMDLARTLVQEKVVACATILGRGMSIYSWNSEIQESAEWVVMMKLPASQTERLKMRLPELHSYQVPELIVTDVIDGHPAYLDWVKQASCGAVDE